MLVAPNGALTARKIVPDAGSFTLVLPRALRLVSGGGSAPVEIGAKIGTGKR